MLRLQPMQNPHFESKFEIKKKTCQNPFYKSLTLVVCKKTVRNNTKYARNETVLKISHYAKAIQPMQNLHFESKIKIQKNMLKSLLQIIQRCSPQKTARKNTKYSRNKTILKIGHHAKACLLYTSPSPRDQRGSRMPSSA